MKNVFLEDWKKAHLSIFRIIYPSLTDEQILEVLNDDINENFQDRDCQLHNDYNDDMLLELTLTTLYQYCKEKKPILAGNGTLFFNQDRVSSPIADLIDERIAARKHYQKIRDQYPPNSPEYQYYDMMQMEAKIRINSIYGSFGAVTFQLYNKYTAASTTGTAQSLISTTAISFEAFIGNDVKFKSMGECMVFMTNIVNERYTLPKLTIRDIDISQVYKRIIDNFETGVFDELSQGDIIFEFLSKLSQEELTKIYYKNNIYEFIKNDCILDILKTAFNKMDNFNDPNAVPNCIQDDMALLWEYCSEYVFYNHAYNERINRLKHEKRTVVKLVDTDSNLVNVQPWVDFLYDQLIPKISSSMDQDTLTFACVNTLAYLVTMMLRELLDKYCDDCHVLERYWRRINMKNEFCFKKLLLAATKKRYVAKIVLKEGRPVVKTEIKGHDFKKSGVTEYVSSKMISIVENRILQPANIEISGILQDLDKLENEIYNSLGRGDREFLIRMNCKNPEAYKNPESMGQYLSVLAWNTIYPEQEITLPDKLDVVLTKIPNIEAIEEMKHTHFYEWDRITRLLLNGPIKSFREKGVRYLALPNNIDGIPEFIRPYIDYDYIISRNIGTFRPILESLELTETGSTDIKFFSNIRYNTTIEI